MLTNVAEWQQASDYGLDSVVIMCIQHQNVGQDIPIFGAEYRRSHWIFEYKRRLFRRSVAS